MDDLKAKIEALRLKDAPQNADYNDALDQVLAILATHAAEPAPVAVEGAPERVWLGPAIGPQGLSTWNVEGMLAGDWDTETSGLNYPKEAVRYIRADLAPTGNTALVEAAAEDRGLRAAAEICRAEQRRREKQMEELRPRLGCMQRERFRVGAQQCGLLADAIDATLSQPAAPQPTPEVDELEERIRYILVNFDDGHAKSDVDTALASILALARGSVAEKGGGDPMDNGPQRIPDYE